MAATAVFSVQSTRKGYAYGPRRDAGQGNEMDMVQVRFSQPPSDKEKAPVIRKPGSEVAFSPERKPVLPAGRGGVSLLIDTAMFEEERLSLPHTVERDPIIAE